MAFKPYFNAILTPKPDKPLARAKKTLHIPF